MGAALGTFLGQSYRRRVGLTLVLCFSGVLAIPEYLAYQGQRARLVSSVMEGAAASTEMLVPRFAHSVHYGEYFELWEELRRIVSVAHQRARKGALLDIREMAVLDNAGVTLGHTRPGSHPLLKPYQSSSFSPQMLKLGWSASWNTDYSQITVNTPLSWDGHRIGLVQVVYTTANLQSSLLALRGQLFLALLLAAAFALALSALLARWVTEPLKALIPMLGRMGDGKVELPASLRRNDEFGALAQALESADRRISESSRELREEALARRDAEAALSAFKTTLDMTLDCVFMFDAQTLRFNYANHGAISQLGFTADELARMTPIDIKPAFDEPDFRALVAPLLSGRQRYIHFETLHRHKDGTDIPVEIMLQYVENSDFPPRFVAIVRDITERRRAQRELQRHNEQLETLVAERTESLQSALHVAEQASNAKSEFLSRMSHELRTPMNAILGFAQLLRTDTRDPLSPEHRENMDEILDAGEHLLALINEMLDLGRIEAGRLDIYPVPVRFADIVAASLKLVRSEADSNRVVIVDDTGECDAVVCADFVRLRQVLINLLGNAIKYNRDGGRVTLSCCLVEGRSVRLDVVDTGVGIRDEDMEKLYTPFERLHTDGAVEGAGIGLVISRRLVELMGGTISVESSFGEGSTFSVELPLYNEDRRRETAI